MQPHAQGALLESELPKLPVGTGYLWSAGGAELRRIAFGANATFDSSRTPRHGDTPPAPIAVSTTLVDELKAALAPTVEEERREFGRMIAELDPDALVTRDARIAELEAELASAKRIGDLLYSRGILIGIERARGALHHLVVSENEQPGLADAAAIADEYGQAPARTNLHHDDASSGAAPDFETAPAGDADGLPAAEDAPPAERSFLPSPAGGVSDREYRALGTLAAIAPAGLTEAAWTARAGYSRKGGAWNARRRRYVDAGLIVQRDGRWYATDAGIAAAGADTPRLPPPGRALVAWWAQRLGAAGRMLELLASVHPKALTRDAIAAELRMAPRGGAFNARIQELRAAELIVETNKRLAIAPALMGSAK